MLEPNDRAMLHDLLRPPSDFNLDIAVGTTYSLDLISLLSAPVSFALFDVDSSDIDSDVSSLEVLESVRRYAGRITVFAMAGQISVPSAYRSVLTYLEDSIIQVPRPREGRVFHPKLWLLRYRSVETSEVHHRIVVLSRNLTYDASWDISAVLDETDDHSGQKCAQPVSRLLQSLTNNTRISTQRKRDITHLARSISRAHFQVPPPFRSVRLHPMGPGFDAVHFPTDCTRALVISPFVSQSRVDSWMRATKKLTLVSRPEELDCLPATSVPEETFVLSAYVQPLEEEAGELSGLHAKLYVADQGSTSTWWLGSANATHAAFDGNSEFLVELTGPTSSVGVKRLLEAKPGELGLTSIIEPYSRSSHSPETGSPARMSIEDETIITIAETGVVLLVGSEKVEGSRTTYPLSLTCDVQPPATLAVWLRPLALRGEDEARQFVGESLCWPGVSLTSVSPYVVVRVHGENVVERVILAELRGDPPTRRDAVLAQLIANQEGFLRYLLLLLSDSSLDIALLHGVSALLSEKEQAAVKSRFDLPLLESLLRSLSRNPEDLHRVRDLLVDLRRTPEGQKLVPDQFDELWAPISEALAFLETGTQK